MASIGKPKIRISAKDLKQAVLKKNKSLESKNKVLESSIKSQENKLKSLDKDYKVESKKLSQLLIDVEFQEDRFQKLKGGIYSNEKLLNDKLKKVGSAEKELCEYESASQKLEDKSNKLKEEIKALEFYKSKCSDSKKELSGLQEKKDDAIEQLASINNDISQLYVNHNSKVISYESEYEGLEERAQKHEDMIHQFEQRLFETKDRVLSEEKKLEFAISKSGKEKKKLNDEYQAIQNLVNSSEDKYIKWEQKIAKIKVKADKEEDRIEKAKTRYENWKIGVLEEVARLKLKSKVEKINKAGLSEILNG